MVQDVRPPSTEQPKRGLRARFGSQSPAVRADHDELAIPAVAGMYIPLTGFGNVTLGDSVQLIKALRIEAQSWARPTVHLEGGTALEFPGDESVWAKITGDTNELNVIGRGVPQIVQRLGFFVDRRAFRAWLSVGTITGTTSAPYLESLVAALDGFVGQSWTIDSVSVMKGLPEEGKDAFEEMEHLPLAQG